MWQDLSNVLGQTTDTGKKGIRDYPSPKSQDNGYSAEGLESARAEADYDAMKEQQENVAEGETPLISNPWKYLLFVGAFILGTFIAKMSKKR